MTTPVEAFVAERHRGTRAEADATFDAWARASAPGLLRFARAVTSGRQEASDAVQDAQIAVYLRWGRLISTGTPDAYARRTIVNRSISWWRKIGRREAPLEAYETLVPGPAAADRTDALVAHDLLRALPARQRAAVVLRYLEDLSFAEIADILSCTESTARSYVHRALTRLRTELGNDHD